MCTSKHHMILLGNIEFVYVLSKKMKTNFILNSHLHRMIYLETQITYKENSAPRIMVHGHNKLILRNN